MVGRYVASRTADGSAPPSTTQPRDAGPRVAENFAEPSTDALRYMHMLPSGLHINGAVQSTVRHLPQLPLWQNAPALLLLLTQSTEVAHGWQVPAVHT